MKLLLSIIAIFLSLQVLAQEQNDNDSVEYYYNQYQYISALPFAKRNFEMAENISANDGSYISTACRLAGIYVALIKLDSALLYYIKAAECAKKLYGDTSLLYGFQLVDVATMHRNLGQYRQAEQGFQDATAIFERMDSVSFKRDNGYYKQLYTQYLLQYASFYIRTGRLNKAEALCQDAYEMSLREPVDRKVYLETVTQLAILYEKMGFYTKLDSMLVRKFETFREEYGENNSAYATAIGGLADIYQRHKKLNEADSLFRKGLEIRRRFTDKNNAGSIPILNRLGIVNMDMGKYDVAENYLEEAADIIHKNGGEEFSLYAYCIKNLAKLYVLTGRKEMAEPLFQKCLAIYNKQGMELHSDRLKLLHDMAELLYADDPDNAAIYLHQAMTAEKKMLLEKLDFLSETELLTHLKANKDVTDCPYRFLLHHKNPAISSEAYNCKLLTSGIVLQNTRTLYQNMAQSKDSTLIILWKNYLQQKTFYKDILLIPASQRKINMDSVATMLNRQEKEILRRSAEYRDMKEKLSIRWQDVQKQLKPDETAIEFVRFTGKQNTYTNTKTDSVYYAALLICQQDTMPRFVLLCEEKQLIAAIKKFPYKAFVNSRGQKTEGYGQSITNALYQLVWQPLDPYLGHTKTIYFSPAGMLHRLAFAAMPYKKGTLLCDKYELVQLTTTRQVALKETHPPAPVFIAMFGGINYNSQSGDSSHGIYTHLYRGSRGAGIDSFPFLPNTLKEINEIKKEAEALQKKPVVFTGNNATEAAFRNLSGSNSPEVIHFATHGFTLPDTVQGSNAGAIFKASDNPLLRCGLVMTGGNIGWKGKTMPGEDDGILTGLEISNVQLPNTQLAVLSACETGLGKIEGSEGVFGLQRAFKLAGVNYIIASLWQVPDKETAEFMETFYSHWLGGKTIRKAFLTTQQTMRKKYAPYYWAAFTLVQ